MCRWHQKFLHTLIVTMLGSAFGACARGTHVFSMHKIGAVPSSAMHLTTIVPVAAKPGDEVTITGSGLSPQSVLRIGGQAVDFTSYSDTSAKFIMPTMPRSGAFGVTIGRYNEGTGTVDAAAKFMLADATDADYPIYMATAADICSPISFRDAQGDIRIGTKDCAKGTVADCAADGAIGCKTVAAFPAADMSVAIPGNIKKDVTIAGTTGNYPSTASPLQLNTATVDLDGQFLTKLTSASAFEYFDSTGAVYAQAGNADIISANIASGVTIFGTTGTITSPTAWDLRAGSSIVSPSGTVAGKLKVNCRNRVNLILQDMDFGRSVSGIASNILTTTAAHGLASNQTVRLHYLTAPSGADDGHTYYVRYLTTTTFSLSTASGPGGEMAISAGTGITVHKWQDGTADIWDTIEDFNNSIVGSPTSVVSGWTNNDCGGKETVLDDANVWKDVTIATTTGGASCAANPSGSPENCTMKDKITGLWWSKLQASGAWNAALSTCGNTLNTTTYGGNSAAGYNGQTGWRLPTQKELMEAYNHGVRSAATTNWMTEANMFTYFWSGSSSSNNPTLAWFVFLASGFTDGNTLKTNTFQFVCVR